MDKKQINNGLNALENVANKTELPLRVNNFMEAYYNAECVCNAPKVVFWLSKAKRDECKKARMYAFDELVNLGITVAKDL